MTDEEAGYILAIAMKQHAVDKLGCCDGAVLLYAYCWLMADLVLQARQVKGIPLDESVACVVAKLEYTVEHLDAHADTAAAVTH